MRAGHMILSIFWAYFIIIFNQEYYVNCKNNVNQIERKKCTAFAIVVVNIESYPCSNPNSIETASNNQTL